MAPGIRGEAVDPLIRASGGEQRPPDIAVGATDVAIRHQAPGRDLGHRAFHDIFRPGPNDWGLVVGDLRSDGDLSVMLDEVTSTIRSASGRHFLPSIVLGKLHDVLADRGTGGPGGRQCAVALSRIEFDACGAWVTLSGAGHPRPIVVRRAGWVDIRGHASAPLGVPGAAPATDRVGLGPGDALVLCSDALTGSRNPDGQAFGDLVLADVLIDSVGQSANAVAERVLAAAAEFGGDRLYDEGLVLVLRVPETIRNEGLGWVSRSTGIPVDQLHLPGYPVGEEQPDLWHERPRPPREALIRLAPEPPSIPALRRLLRRLLQSWRMDLVAEGDMELLITEVATNAFSYTASPVTVIVRYTGSVVRVEVGDGPRDLPRRRRGGFDDLRGHRLALVESLASDWGFLTIGTGTRIWFEVSAARTPSEAATPGSAC